MKKALSVILAALIIAFSLVTVESGADNVFLAIMRATVIMIS